MNYILHLETATKTCSVCLSLNGELKQIIESTEDSFSHGENLTLFIEACLKKEKINPSDLKAISISSGPGSYTGLRIGASVAKGLCYSLNIPIITINSLLCLYEGAKIKHPKSTIIPMIDARRMEVFSAVYSNSGSVKKEISADILTENTYSEFEPFVACGDSNEKLKEFWKGRNLIYDDHLIPSASHQINLAYSKYIHQEFENVAYFEPFYLKDFMLAKK